MTKNERIKALEDRVAWLESHRFHGGYWWTPPDRPVVVTYTDPDVCCSTGQHHID